MAEQNITSFLINSSLIGILIISMIGAFILIANNEGRGEIFDDYPEIEAYNLNLTNVYTDGDFVDTANTNLNLSAGYDPTFTQSGADKSGNAISISIGDLTNLTWTMISLLGALLFGNIFSSLLSGFILAIIGYLIVQYSIKWIRTGT